MATLSGASGTPTSITLTVSGMSASTEYKRKYEYILAGTVMATTTDATAGTTTTSRIITGLTADTLYVCRVRIYNSNTGSLVAEVGPISVRTLAESAQQVAVSILNYLDNLTNLTAGSYKGDEGGTFLITAPGTQYQTYASQYKFLYFRLSSQNYSTEHDTSYRIPITSGQTVKVYYQSKTTTVPIYNYLDGQNTLASGSVSGTIGNTFFLSMSGTQYQTYSQEYEFLYFRLASEGYATDHAASEMIPITSGQAVRVYYKTKITATAPYISGVALTKDTATVTWSKNGGGYGSWTLYWGTRNYTAIGSQSIGSSPVTVSGLDPGTTYYFWIVNKAGTDSKTSNTVSGSTKAQIAAFSWTSDDATRIAAGKPVTNLTAASWNRLTTKINEVRAERGYGSLSFTSAYAGMEITASLYNQAANAIASLPGAGTVRTAAVGEKLTAAHFANDSMALKEALNRAINSYNG